MIEKIPFGRTGHQSTRVLFGAAALKSASQEEADRAIEAVMEYGVNHIDTAASYGHSERLLGPWLEKERSRFFLATKTGQRRYREARDELHRSLERLRVDHVDLIQMHNLVDPQQWEIAMGPGGVLEALVEARDEGLVRFIGVTGHGITTPEMHRRSLERFDFDTVMLPYNYLMMQNPGYAEAFETLAALCEARNVALQTIKAIARRPYGERAQTHSTWYEPLEAQDAIDRAVHWVMGRPGIFLTSAGDVHLLPRFLEAASRFEGPPAASAMAEQEKQETMEPLFV